MTYGDRFVLLYRRNDKVMDENKQAGLNRPPKLEPYQ